MNNHIRNTSSLALITAAMCIAQPSDNFGVARLQSGRAYRVSSNNALPSSNDDSKRVIPGETVVLADLAGPGVVTHIWLTVAANEYAWPRLVRFRVYYDGSAVPSVDAPLGDFFAVGHGLERQVDSLLIRNSSSGRSRNSYWPMPFRKSCKITVTNEGRQRVHALYYHVDWRKVDALPDDVGYFHARYQQKIPAENQGLRIASLEGRGQYVGMAFSVIQAEPGWFGEGDEWVYIDGEDKGTGTEDYFNDAWSLRVAQGAHTGVPVADGTGSAGARMTAYRWHSPDPIPFARSFRFDLEHAGWTYFADGRVRSAFQERFDLFSWVSYWYQQGIAQGQPEPPYGSSRLPHGNARQIEAESLIGSAKTERGRAKVQKEVFWSRDILHLDAEGARASVEISFDVAEEGLYELLAQVALAPDYGIYQASLDGKTLVEGAKEHEPGANERSTSVIDGYHHEVYVAEDRVLAWRTLSKGVHRLQFRCVGKNASSTGYGFGLDTLIVARVGQLKSEDSSRAAQIRREGEHGKVTREGLQSALAESDQSTREAAMWSFTQHPALASQGVAALRTALSDSDAVVRGLAAIALRNCGACAEAALKELTLSLKDPDPNVRIAAADAIARLGPKAAPALAGLIELGRAPDQHPHVLRSVSSTLGAIGPAAAEAIPVLEQMRQHVRVRWTAEAAIASIRQRPIPEGPEPGGVKLQ